MDISQPQEFPDDTFRPFQTAVVPGVEGLHRSMRAILDSQLNDHATILVVGAGGGRELQTLGTSPRSFKLTGVDPSTEMLDLARAYTIKDKLCDRTTLVEGVVEDLPEDMLFNAATALFVMHFLPDDGGKARFLDAIRKRLKLGAAYLHVDVCFENRAMYDRLESVYARQAILSGLAADAAASVAARVGTMPIISEAATLDHFARSGFKLVAPFFRGLWYAGWWLEAV